MIHILLSIGVEKLKVGKLFDALNSAYMNMDMASRKIIRSTAGPRSGTKRQAFRLVESHTTQALNRGERRRRDSLLDFRSVWRNRGA